ncbi:MAG TPA: argininosuccinate synthase domain-containing protein [Jatrophihabitans sp.]|uniref:argininosuccinate synthase domain-containing protein n=1 Tax=Jatrophihabitans sp. TaxID=1932789 RepID=UPI002F06E002
MQNSEFFGRRVGIALSGGLSSLAVGARLLEDGHDVVGLAGYLGQCEPAEFDSFVDTVRASGMPVRTVDLTPAMATAALDLIAFDGHYDGGYWNTTGLSREVIVAGLADEFHDAKCEVLAHGCVGGGNDQRRFERNGARYLPDIPVFAPWTDPEMRAKMPDRAAMAEYLDRRGLVPMPGNTAEHSIEGNLAGVSHEDASLEDLRTTPRALPRQLGVAPEEAPDSITTLTIGIERARPVELDGRRLPPAELLRQANLIAGRCGLGLVDVFENRVNGTKCRGVYEAPGMQLLSSAVRTAYETVTDRAADELRRTLSRVVGVSVYEATTGSLAARAARAGLEEMARLVNAVIELEIYKGAVIGRAIKDVDHAAQVVHQRRFAGTGHNWASGPLTVSSAAWNGS